MKQAAYSAILFLTGIGAPAWGQESDAATPDCDNHLVSISASGEVIAGSKIALKDAVSSGRIIRVGFGLGSGDTYGYFLTHWFDARFLTILGEDVFTQAPMIHRQTPDSVKGDIKLYDAPVTWTATLGTNGALHSRLINEDTVSSHKVDSWWCAAG